MKFRLPLTKALMMMRKLSGLKNMKREALCLCQQQQVDIRLSTSKIALTFYCEFMPASSPSLHPHSLAPLLFLTLLIHSSDSLSLPLIFPSLIFSHSSVDDTLMSSHKNQEEDDEENLDKDDEEDDDEDDDNDDLEV